MFGKQKMCSICKVRPATQIYQEIVNGKGVEFCFCDECAKKTNLDENYNIFLSDMFGDLFAPAYKQSNVKQGSFSDSRRKVCKCGTTEDDIINTGRFGCSECYKTFSDLVDKYVQRLGGKTYSGAMPEHISDKNEKVPTIEEKIALLTRQMHEAADKQDYNTAEKIREQIVALKNNK